MNRMAHKLRATVALILTCAASSLPSCASMGGGGGMHKLVGPPGFAAPYGTT